MALIPRDTPTWDPRDLLEEGHYWRASAQRMDEQRDRSGYAAVCHRRAAAYRSLAEKLIQRFAGYAATCGCRR